MKYPLSWNKIGEEFKDKDWIDYNYSPKCVSSPFDAVSICLSLVNAGNISGAEYWAKIIQSGKTI